MVPLYKNIGSFRFLLAFLVLTSHSGSYLPTYVHELFLGNIGVLIFFIVSGYVIAESCDLFYQNKFNNFIFNRFMKLYPTYLLTVLICYILAGFVNLSNSIGQINYDIKSIFANLTLLPSYFKYFNNLNFLGQTWALIVEFQFYLIYGIFVIKINNNILRKLISYIFIIISLYILIFDKYNKFYSSIYYSPFFIFGVMSYKYSIIKSKYNLIGMYTCLILAIIFYYNYNLKGASLNGGQWNYNNGLPLNVIYSTILFTIMVLLFLWLCNLKSFIKYKFIDLGLGDITYSMYLIHVPIIALVDVFLNERKFIGYLLILFFTIFFSVLINVFYEKNFTKIRSKIRGYIIN